MMPKTHLLSFRADDEEISRIESKMNQCGIKNMSAYLRKAAIDGIIVNLDIQGISTLINLMRKYGTNINQIAKRVNATGSIYMNEIEEIKGSQKEIYDGLNAILKQLSKLK